MAFLESAILSFSRVSKMAFPSLPSSDDDGGRPGTFSETWEIASSSAINSVMARMHTAASSAESASVAAMASLVELCCAEPESARRSGKKMLKGFLVLVLNNNKARNGDCFLHDRVQACRGLLPAAQSSKVSHFVQKLNCLTQTIRVSSGLGAHRLGI